MPNYRMNAWDGSPGPAAWLVIALGVVLALIGLPLVIGGVWLIALGGSWYYLLAGLALVASGALIASGRLIGVWLYIALYVATIVWALWEVGLQGWPLVPRVLAPTILLVFVLLAVPVLRGHGGRSWLVMLGSAAAFVLVGGLAIGLANRADDPADLPGTLAGGMGDPSLMRTGADWPAYGGTDAARRWSPLDQITPDNVDELERVWTYHTGDTPEEKWGAETTPLKIGDTVYLCSARNILIALDAGTGEER